MLVCVIGDILGIGMTIWQDIHVPLWVWILIIVAGLFVAQFLAFHKVRLERDELKIQLLKPILFIRSCRYSRMAKDYTQKFQRFPYLYEVTIANPSANLPLGIQRIVLTWEKLEDERQTAAFTPVVGDIDIREDETEQSIKGKIGSVLNLQPNEVKEGKLLFIIEENRFMACGKLEDAILQLVDSHGNKFKYKAKVNDILG